MAAVDKKSTQPLAIIGMACRLPGADDLDQYWRLIVEARTPVGEVPHERMDQSLYYDPQVGVRGKSYSKLACLLSSRQFDHARCPIPESLVNSVDNTHLLMTGVAAEALRHAGLDPFNLRSKNTAVFIGHAQGSSQMGDLTYAAYLDEAVGLLAETPGFEELPASEQRLVIEELATQLRRGLPAGQPEGIRNLYCNMVSGTIAKAFGLSGPWLALNSACASSLHAMLLGARALQLGRADMAIVGGASDCKFESLVLFSQAQTLSKTASRPFDADADGLIMSEGYVALVLKTLERARADGDPIQAVVRGLGVASDGRGKSLWAPRKEGQMKAMLRAYHPGLDMAGLQYLEAHATSTQVGDATELETLGEVLSPKFPPGKKIPVTSAKASIGHTLESAGIAGVIKTVLCMQNQTFPPSVNIRTLNSKVDWEKAPYFIPMAPAPWSAPADGGPRRAAVNAFGIGGLNMHVVLDEYTDAARTTIAASTNGHAPAADDNSVAIVGMGCVLPGALGLEKYWDLLRTGRDPKSAPPAARWTRHALDQQARGTVGGFITDFEYDWRKHKVPPKQVAEADPLQFMLLDAAQQALIDAGYDKKPYDRERTGVTVGTEFGGDFSDHLEIGLRLPEMRHALAGVLRKRGMGEEKIQALGTGLSDVLLRKWPSLIDETGSFTSSTLASRITKTLDLAGGAVSIDSGSTSAMSALSIAIDMLLAGDNDIMICAAGQRRMGHNAFTTIERAGRLAQAKARNLLDAAYDGIVPAEGVGVVVLKRLADARRDGDRIHAVIRGFGIAHDPSHETALRLAAERSCTMAGIDPAQITLLELDTDERLTPTGAELNSLVSLYGGVQRVEPLVAGSLVSQLGHLGGAAPMASLIKASLEIEHAEMAPAVELGSASPGLGAAGPMIQMPKSGAKLPARRVAALASWSNGLACHVILEPADAVATQRPAAAAVPQSAAVRAGAAQAKAPIPAAVARMGASLSAAPKSVTSPATPAPSSAAPAICRFGAASSDDLLAQVNAAAADPQRAWQQSSTARFHTEHQYRLAIVATGAEALAQKLKLAGPQLLNPAARQVLEQQGIVYRQKPARRPRVAFVFPGQGSQYDGMLRDLVTQSPAAGNALREIDATLSQLGYPSLARLAWEVPTPLGTDVWSTQLSMLLADAIVLAALGEQGIVPELVLGHSYGEFPALYAAGVWDLATAARMTRARVDGILTVSNGDTGMLATAASADVVQQLINASGRALHLANLNAPDQNVIGGRRADLEAFVPVLAANGQQGRILPVPAAFHTPLLSGASRILEQALAQASLAAPRVPLISTVTNSPVRDAAEVRRNLAAQLTTPVRYAELIARLAAETPTVFVEVGPQQTLTRLNRKILDAAGEAIATDNPKRAGSEPLLAVRALLECLGVFDLLVAANGSATTKPSRVPAQAAAREMSATRHSPAKSVPPTNEADKSSMHESIPHFDATQRRRDKMRASGSPAATGGSAPRAAAASPPPEKSAVAARPAPAAPHTAPKPAPAPRMAAPPAPTFAPSAPSKPPVAPAPVASANGNGAAHHPVNGLASSVPTPSVAPQPAAAPSAPASAATRAAATSPQELEAFLINFVVEQTGYPPEVVELDADLEADLGIDSIKKAQLFGELQEYFDIGASATELSLDDFPTLRHVVNFLAQSSSTAPAPAPQTAAAPVAASPPPITVTVSQEAAAPLPGVLATNGHAPANNAAELESFLINFVVEQTGYPPEVVELDADLEADLGIDSIKKAQLFGELQEYFDIGATATELSLDDFPTLRHVLDFLQQAGSSSPAGTNGSIAGANGNGHVAMAPGAPQSPVEIAAPADLTPPVAAVSPAPAAAPTNGKAPGGNAAELEAFLINFVVEQTGYPPEVVELDADLEADLGIDSIKKAQLFGELQEYFDIGATATELSLDDFPTLRHVLNFLQQAGSSAPGSAGVNEDVQHASATVEPALAVADTHTLAPAAVAESPAPQDSAELESFLVNFVVEQTGYPPEVVDLDADLEADLGIDSIKKAQLFGELQEYFDIGASATDLSLDDFPTLRHVLDFLRASGTAAPSAAVETAATVDARESSVATASPPVEATSATESAPMRLAGTPYELGLEHGRRYQALIRRVLRTYVERANDELEITSSGKLPIAGLSPDELDELQGIADGAQVPLGSLLVHHRALVAEGGAGSGQFAVSAAESQAGQMAHGLFQAGRSHGLPLDTWQPAIFVRLPHEGIPHLAIAPLGSVEILAGINAAGLAITVSALPAASDGTISQVRATVARPVLERATDVATAIALAKTAVGTRAWRACVSHAPSDQVAYLEFDGRSLTVHGDERLVAVGDFVRTAVASSGAHHTNGHHGEGSLWKQLEASDSRQPHAIARAIADATSLAWAKGTLSDDSLAVVFEPSLGQLWLSAARIGDEVKSCQLSTAALLPAYSAASPKSLSPAQSNGRLTDLPSSPVTSRFVLEMREAPLAVDTPAEPIWNGAAIVMGSDEVADALRNRLRQAGLEVHSLSGADELDQVLAELGQICAAGPAPHLFITTAGDDAPIDACGEPAWAARREEQMILPFFVCQKWVELATAGQWLNRATLAATTALGGDFGLARGTHSPDGGALAGLLKAIYIEAAIVENHPDLRVKAIDAPANAAPDALVANILRELAADRKDYEVAYVDDQRLVPFAVERDAKEGLKTAARTDIQPGSNWIVTGGARGITAACALELGRRYGLKLHLLGTTEIQPIDPAWRDLDDAGLQKLQASVMVAARKAGQPAAQAWQRVRKDIEIDRSLRAFEVAGLAATYHACDVADRAALERTLGAIRRQDGPIAGVLHGAGIDRSCRFDRKQPDVVRQTIGAKVDGAAHLMALLRRDPVRHFVGFGSISGRLGSFGQTDYCLASDALAKLMGSIRRQRPWIKAIGFHWHPWDEIGMAARPETKSILQSKSDLRLMPPAEGIAHLLRELDAGVPEPEILITERRHWERFASGMDIQVGKNGSPAQTSTGHTSAKHGQNGHAATHAPATPVPAAQEPVEEVALHTHRCELRAIASPLAPGSQPASSLGASAWIVGANPTATALAARLQAMGTAVWQVPTTGDLDQVLAQLEARFAAEPCTNLFLLSGRDEPLAAYAAQQVADQRREEAILLPFFIAQRWYKLLAARPDLGRANLVAAVSLGGDFGFGGRAPTPDGGALSGLLKAVHIEDGRREAPRVRAKVVDAPANELPSDLVESLLMELGSAEPEVEVCWSRGTRRVVRPLRVADHDAPLSEVPRGGTWVVTGGARGITAIAARELARRYGWRLHLVGKSPAPLADAPWRNYSPEEMKALKTSLARQAVSEGRSPSEAWDRVMKDVEIFNNLASFKTAGVEAHYHACDIASRDALASVLDEVRRVSGPIHGILHGAGVIDPSRFESKRRDLVRAQIGAKFDGTLNLMALTERDPLAYFVGFGSISGRFGGNGLTDYAAGNDAMSKVLDWFRAARPACKTATIHWESWEGSGMATLPRFAWGPKAVMNMKYMLPEEGVRRLEQELAAGLADAEVLYTFGDFYPMFYPAEQQPLGEFVPGQVAEAKSNTSPLLRNVQHDGNALSAEVPLDPTADPFLLQHRLRNKPLLPVVVGLEILLEAARGASQQQVLGFRDVRMVDGLLFRTDRALVARARATKSDEGYACELSCDFHNRQGGLIQQDRPYLRAMAEVAAPGSSPQAPLLAFEQPPAISAWTDFSYPEDAAIFHGPAFRGATSVCGDATRGWGRILALPLAGLAGAERASGWTIPSTVLDAALFACGVHLWMHSNKAVSLPKAIGRVQLGRPAIAGEACLIHFVCREVTADAAKYDFTVVGADGQTIISAQDYQKVILTREVPQ